MTLNEYQQQALDFDDVPADLSIIYPGLGITGEAGEVADKIKKVFRDNNRNFTPEIKRAIAMEIGDVLWYCAKLAHDIGYSMDSIGNMNIGKLTDRRNRGVIQGSGDNR